jgi:hypothetical protein
MPKETESSPPESRELRTSGNSLLATGLGIAAIGVAGAAIGVVCVVAAPALAGAGVIQRLRSWRKGVAEREGIDDLASQP